MSATQAHIREAFAPLFGEHRLELVALKDGVTYINNSASTSVNAAWYALESMPAGRRVHWLVGGCDVAGMVEAWQSLLPTARSKVKAVYDIGMPLSQALKAAMAGHFDTQGAPYISLWHAVMTARAMAGPGDIVLLSPGARSFDRFTDHEQRGRAFKQAVADI